MKELPTYTALVDSFSKLPGIGVKSAERMAYAVLEMRDEDATEFAKAIEDAKRAVHKCPNCGLFTEKDFCEICSDPNRSHEKMIVVSFPKDVFAFERLGTFNGVYHVLGGTISASKGIGAEELTVDKLLSRVTDEGVKEVILATNPTLDGETTALYIAKLLEDKHISITRLANGIPMGGSLEYADTLTLNKALEGRKKL